MTNLEEFLFASLIILSGVTLLLIIRIGNDNDIINGLKQEKKSLRRFRGLEIGQRVFIIKHSKITYGKITWISLYKNPTSGAIEESIEIDHCEELVDVKDIYLTEEEAIDKLKSII